MTLNCNCGAGSDLRGGAESVSTLYFHIHEIKFRGRGEREGLVGLIFSVEWSVLHFPYSP